MKSAWLKSMRCSLLIIVAAVGFAGVANAAPCAPNTDPTTICPAYSICLNWQAPTTREIVANEPVAQLAANEIKGYKIKLDSLAWIVNSATNFTYTVPANAVVPTTAVWSIATIDTDNRESTKPFTCTQPVMVAGPKSSPAAPNGLTTATAK